MFDEAGEDHANWIFTLPLVLAVSIWVILMGTIVTNILDGELCPVQEDEMVATGTKEANGTSIGSRQ